MKYHLWMLLVVVLLASAAVGCSEDEEVESCTTAADCSKTPGRACNAGVCEEATLPKRCGESEPADLLTSPEKYTNAMVFGSLLEKTNVTQQARRDSIKLAVRQLNANGGFDDRRFGVVFCDIDENSSYDTLSKDAAVENSAEILAETLGLPAIVGPTGSADTEKVYGLIKEHGTVIISPSATSPNLTGLEGINPTDAEPGILWRTAAPDSLQGRAIAEDVTARGVMDIFIIHQVGAYGEGLSAEFQVNYEGTVTVNSFSSNSERSAAVIKASEARPEEVLFISSELSDSVAFLDAVGGIDAFFNIKFFLTDGANNDLFSLLSAEGKTTLDRVRRSQPAVPISETYQNFRSALQSGFGHNADTMTFTPHSYDAAMLVMVGMVHSIFRSGKIESKHIAGGLRKVSSGERLTLLPQSWGAIAESLKRGQSFNAEGASGALDYDPTTEETVSAIDVSTVNAAGDGFEVVETFVP